MGAFLAGAGIAGLPLAVVALVAVVRHARSKARETTLKFQLAEQRAMTVTANERAKAAANALADYQHRTEAENATTMDHIQLLEERVRECGADDPAVLLDLLRVVYDRLEKQADEADRAHGQA